MKNLAPAEARSHVFALAVIVSFAAAPAAADPLILNQPAQTLNQTLDSFSPTPKQTIALRDFLGARGEKIVPLGTQPNGLTTFDLRDAKNQRVGQIAVGRDEAEGSIFIARLGGPATFDVTRRSNPPRVLDPKMRGAIHALLAGAQAGPAFDAAVAKNHDLFMRDRPMQALTVQPITFPDRIFESEASFFADGSGFLRTIRAPVGLAPTAPQTMAAIRVSAKYYPALDADGQKAFRAAVLGVDAEFSATLAGLGNKVPCTPAPCTAPPPVTMIGEAHLTRWPHAIVPSAPANLIAQITPPPVTPILQDPLTQQSQDSGAIDATGSEPHTN